MFPDPNAPLPTREEMLYTERARKVFKFAREEAWQVGARSVGNVHVLLGMLREGEGIGCILLSRLNVDPKALRARLEGAAAGAGVRIANAPLPKYEPSIQAILDLAIDEALGLKHRYVGSEHLLLALAHEASGTPAAALASVGVTLEIARQELMDLYGQ